MPSTSLLARFDPAAAARLVQISQSMAESLDRWASRYPLIRRERILPLSMSVAAGAPFASRAALIATARLSLWVFTVDDVFDEHGLAHGELLARTAVYRSIADGHRPATTHDPLAGALRDVYDDLARYPLFDRLHDQWAAAFRGTLEGMLREDRWRQIAHDRGLAAALPTYDQYVANGRYSIGGPPHMWAAVITTGDATAARHIPYLARMEDLASTCVRLANDLRSYDREQAEGNINALVILSHNLQLVGLSAADALAQARQMVEADMTSRLAELAGLRDAFVTETGLPEGAMDSIARFVCQFYAEHDYHTYAPALADARAAA